MSSEFTRITLRFDDYPPYDMYRKYFVSTKTQHQNSQLTKTLKVRTTLAIIYRHVEEFSKLFEHN